MMRSALFTALLAISAALAAQSPSASRSRSSSGRIITTETITSTKTTAASTSTALPGSDEPCSDGRELFALRVEGGRAGLTEGPVPPDPFDWTYLGTHQNSIVANASRHEPASGPALFYLLDDTMYAVPNTTADATAIGDASVVTTCVGTDTPYYFFQSFRFNDTSEVDSGEATAELTCHRNETTHHLRCASACREKQFFTKASPGKTLRSGFGRRPKTAVTTFMARR